MPDLPHYHSTSNRLLLLALAAPPGAVRSHIAAAAVSLSGFYTNDRFRAEPLLVAQIEALLQELAADFVASPDGELASVISHLRDARTCLDDAVCAITRSASSPQSGPAPQSMNSAQCLPATAKDVLATFLLRHAATPIDKLTDAIEAACRQGCGVWMNPTPAVGADTSHRRPATHLYEISLFGISSTGFTAAQAAANWRRVAMTIADGDCADGEITF